MKFSTNRAENVEPKECPDDSVAEEARHQPLQQRDVVDFGVSARRRDQPIELRRRHHAEIGAHHRRRFGAAAISSSSFSPPLIL